MNKKRQKLLIIFVVIAILLIVCGCLLSLTTEEEKVKTSLASLMEKMNTYAGYQIQMEITGAETYQETYYIDQVNHLQKYYEEDTLVRTFDYQNNIVSFYSDIKNCYEQTMELKEIEHFFLLKLLKNDVFVSNEPFSFASPYDAYYFLQSYTTIANQLAGEEEKTIQNNTIEVEEESDKITHIRMSVTFEDQSKIEVNLTFSDYDDAAKIGMTNWNYCETNE